MPFDLQKLTPFDFCVLVLWFHGMSIGQIAKTIGRKHGRTPASIRGIVAKKITTPRAEMSREDRQLYLDFLKMNRKDGGSLVDSVFAAGTVKESKRPVSHVKNLSAYKKDPPVEEVIDTSKMTKSQLKIHKRGEAKKKVIAARDEILAAEKRKEGHAEARSIFDAPLEFLSSKDMLAEKDEKLRGDIEKTPAEMRRLGAGIYLRNILEKRNIGGLKSQNFESVGGSGGVGVGISAQIVEAVSISRSIESMMQPGDFPLLVRLLYGGEFVWKVPSKIAQEKILEDIKRGLDCVAVQMGYMSAAGFDARWGFFPDPARATTRKEARAVVEIAREMILDAQRTVK